MSTIDYDEPWYDDADEETFRPWADSLPVGPEQGMFLVRATFKLADGRSLQGFVTPQAEGEEVDLGIIQPQMFMPSGERCGFWDGMFKRFDAERTAFYKELGKDPKAVFPIEYSAEAGLAAGHTAGTIAGFYHQAEGSVEVYQ